MADYILVGILLKIIYNDPLAESKLISEQLQMVFISLGQNIVHNFTDILHIMFLGELCCFCRIHTFNNTKCRNLNIIKIKVKD